MRRHEVDASYDLMRHLLCPRLALAQLQAFTHQAGQRMSTHATAIDSEACLQVVHLGLPCCKCTWQPEWASSLTFWRAVPLAPAHVTSNLLEDSSAVLHTGVSERCRSRVLLCM